MKKITLFMAMIIALSAITFSCSKDDSQDKLRAALNNAESLVLKTFREAKSNDDSLAKYVDPYGQPLNPTVFMMDSLYHMNDSLCNVYYLTYCEEMLDGDNMIGGNMMSGGMMHGSDMMATHPYMVDTSMVNQYYRELNMIRQVHPAHHPIETSEHELHHR